MRSEWIPLTAITLMLWTAPAGAQQAAPPSSSGLTDLELAKAVHNPFEDFLKVPINAVSGFNVGGNHSVGEAINVEPLIPIHLTPKWDLLVRPNMTLVYLPNPDAQFGLSDSQTSFFLTPEDANTWIWGVGPIFQFPTASSTDLGTGKWCAGPEGAVAYNGTNWFNAVLTYQLMSFAGAKHRGSVNQTYIEPEVSYNWDSGFYAQVDPPISYDWTAQKRNAWILPVGADVGDIFDFGEHMSLQLGAYDFVKHPQGGPGWMLRAQVTLLFPTTR